MAKICFYITLIITILYFPCSAQSTKTDSNIKPADAKENSLNLMIKKIGEDIGDARIVLIGEQSHYDGATFTTRLDLIKFLHEEKGFNLLVFESGLYDMYKANILRKKKPIIEILDHTKFSKGSLMGNWLETNEFSLLVNYLKDNPDLIIAGFDCQINSAYALENLIPDITAFFKNNSLPITLKEAGLLEEAIYEVEGGDFKNFLSSQPEFNNFIVLLNSLETKLKLIHEKNPRLEDTFFWLQWIRNFRGTVIYSRNEGQGQKFTVQNPRDSLMADNFEYIVDRHTDKKVIGIGASFHFARNLDLVDLENTKTENYLVKRKDWDGSTSLSTMLEGAIPMGHYLKKTYGDDLYSIAFTSHQGKWGYLNDSNFIFEISTPPENSIESTMLKSGNFFDFLPSKEITDDSVFSSVFGYLPILAQWNKIFDGFAYIEKADTVTPRIDSLFTSDRPLKIQGKVLDKETNNPLPYANIFVNNTSSGTVSNFEGNFELSISSINSTDSILISYMGYESSYIFIGSDTKNQKIVYLKPTGLLLDQVEINASLTTEQIFEKVRENLTYNYLQQPFSSEVFFREKRIKNDSLIYLEEAALEFYDAVGYQRESNRNINNKFFQINQLKSSLSRKQNKNLGIYDIQQFLIFDPVLSENNITGKRRIKHYNATILGIKEFGDQSVYEIAFECTKPTVFSTGFGYPSPSSYEGKIYINTEDFSVLRYEAKIERSQRFIKKLKFLKQFGIKKPSYFTWSQKMVFSYKKINDHYFLHYSKATDHYDFLVGELKEPNNQIFQSEILNNKINHANPVELKENKLFVDPQDLPYDEEFWKTFILVEDTN